MERAGRLIANRLRKYRLLLGYEQTQVAFLLGLKSHARISEWEQGTSKPSLDNLFKLSLVYQVLPDELYYDLRQEYALEINQRKKELLARRIESG